MTKYVAYGFMFSSRSAARRYRALVLTLEVTYRDTPDTSVVGRMADRFLETNGGVPAPCGIDGTKTYTQVRV